MNQQIFFIRLSGVSLLGLAGVLFAAEPESKAVEGEASPSIKAKLLITGLHCRPCTSTVEQSLKSVKGVRSAKVDWATKNATVEFDEQQITAQQLCTRVAETRHMMGGNMQYGSWLALKVPDIATEGNADKAKAALAKVKGVNTVAVYLPQKSVGVSFVGQGKVTSAELIDALKAAGLEASVSP